MGLFTTVRYRENNGKPLILFYNDFFGRPPDTQSLAHIESCIFTIDKRQLSKADAVIFHVPSIRKFRRIRKRRGQLWVAWSMESEVHYPLLADSAFMRKFDISMTYRRSADVWCSYVPELSEIEKAMATPIPEKTAVAPVAMFQSALTDRSGRNLLARDLMNYIPVHSYGRFMNNRKIEGPDFGKQTKLATIAPYKFCVAFENSIGIDYVTEKFFDPLLSGTVPVYLGAPNIEMFAPDENAFINASNFSTARELAQCLRHLDQNDDEYRTYLDWRNTELSPGFLRLISAASVEPFRRLCEIVALRRKMTRSRWTWFPGG